MQVLVCIWQHKEKQFAFFHLEKSYCFIYTKAAIVSIKSDWQTYINLYIVSQSRKVEEFRLE